MATCKKTVYQAVKVNKVDGTIEVVGDPFDFTGTTIDPATLGNCPEVKYTSNTLCITSDGTDCIESVERKCAINYDCATETTTVDILAYILPDGTVVEAADFIAPYAVIPCPEFEIVSDMKCESA